MELANKFGLNDLLCDEDIESVIKSLQEAVDYFDGRKWEDMTGEEKEWWRS